MKELNDTPEDLTPAIDSSLFQTGELAEQGKKKDYYFDIIGRYLNGLHLNGLDGDFDKAKTEVYDLLKDMPKPAPDTLRITKFYEMKLGQLTDQQLLNLCYLAIKYNPKSEEFFDSALVLLKHMARDELRATAEYQYFMSWQKVRQEAKAAESKSDPSKDSYKSWDKAMRAFQIVAQSPDFEPKMRDEAFTEASKFVNQSLDNAKSNNLKEQDKQSNSFVATINQVVKKPSAKEISVAKYKGLLGAAMMVAGAAAMVVGGLGIAASIVALPLFGSGALGVPLSVGVFTSGSALFGKGLDLYNEAKTEKKIRRVRKADTALKEVGVALQTAATRVVAAIPASEGERLVLSEEQQRSIPLQPTKRKISVTALDPKGKEEEKKEEKEEASANPFMRDDKDAKSGVSQSEFDPRPASIAPKFLLHAAVKDRDLESIKSLLESRAVDVNALDRKERTALEYAVRDGLNEIVTILCGKGAKAEHLPRKGYDAVLSAAEKGEADIVIALINAGANVNAAGGNGPTPLHYAAQQGLVGVVKVLLAKGADINARDADGRDALFYASISRSAGSESSAIILSTKLAEQKAIAERKIEAEKRKAGDEAAAIAERKIEAEKRKAEDEVAAKAIQQKTKDDITGNVLEGITKADNFLKESPPAMEEKVSVSQNRSCIFSHSSSKKQNDSNATLVLGKG